MLVVVALILQVVLYVVFVVLGIAAVVLSSPIWVIGGLILVAVDILNGNSSAPVHDILQSISNAVQSVITFINQINFG